MVPADSRRDERGRTTLAMEARPRRNGPADGRRDELTASIGT